MTTIDTVPPPLTFREKMSAVWSILRNRRYRGRTESVLYTYAPYVVEAYFPAEEGESAVRVVFQFNGRDHDAAPRAVREADLREGREPSNLRIIRRKDLSVTQVIGEGLPDAFRI